jgi:hypothetical protein
MPLRYRSVSRPWAKAEKAMHPTPSVLTTSRRRSSIQRLSIEYDGWWMSNGVPSRRRIVTASAVRWSEYEETPIYRALPEVTAEWRAPRVSSSGVSGS